MKIENFLYTWVIIVSFCELFINGSSFQAPSHFAILSMCFVKIMSLDKLSLLPQF